MVGTIKLQSICSSVMALVLLVPALCISGGEAGEPLPSEVIGKDASACRRKAMDYRVLALNALKNADAARAKAHEALVRAMDSGESETIKNAMDKHENAADDLEETIEDVEKVITYAMDADVTAKKVLSMCKDADESKKDDKALDEKKCRSMLAAGAKSLGKAERLVKRLKKDWLEPAFATTTTTSTTTSTTNSGNQADKK